MKLNVQLRPTVHNGFNAAMEESFKFLKHYHSEGHRIRLTDIDTDVRQCLECRFGLNIIVRWKYHFLAEISVFYRDQFWTQN